MSEEHNKACPFCGGKPKLLNRLDVEDNKMKTLYKVTCSACHASTAEYDSNVLALMAWNNRAGQKDE